MRGLKNVETFAEAMLQTLNSPQNINKPGWHTMTRTALLWKLLEEFAEVLAEIFKVVVLKQNPDALGRECVDLANCAMFLREWAERKGGKNVNSTGS